MGHKVHEEKQVRKRPARSCDVDGIGRKENLYYKIEKPQISAGYNE